MKQKSVHELILGINSLVEKNRASLTVEEVELLESVKLLLLDLTSVSKKEEKDLLMLQVALKLFSFYLSPHVIEKFSDLVQQLFNLL